MTNKTNFEKVQDFHKAFDIKKQDVDIDSKSLRLRFELMCEEFREYTEAFVTLMGKRLGEDAVHGFMGRKFPDLVGPNGSKILADISLKTERELFIEMTDALTDIQYIGLGSLDLLGVDADKAFDIVHNSNMSKLDADGKPIVNDGKIRPDLPIGKVVKSENYVAPDLAEVVPSVVQ